MTPARLAGACGLALALAACAVGPHYKAPQVTPSARGGFISGGEAAFTAGEPQGTWWRLFDSPELDSLVQDAFTANTDLRVAAANLAQARAALEGARSARLPTTTLTGGGTYGKAADNTVPVVPGVPTAKPKPGWIYDAAFDVSYEVDLFGRIRRGVEAAKGDEAGARAALDATRVTVAAETARAYADACADAAELAVANRTVQLQQQTYDLTQSRLQIGVATQLEASEARAQLETTRAALPPLEAQRQASLFSLAVLTGRAPADLPGAASQCAATPQVASVIPIGDGANLLRRRPDVREAERALAANVARIGVATADLYPTVSLGGNVGTAAPRIGDLGSGKSISFSLGPLITWSFPNITTALANIHGANAVADASLAGFDKTVLTALQETETALSAYARELDRRTALQAARDESLKAEQLAELQYKVGTLSFLNLLDTQRTLASAEASLAQSQAAVADDQITLFKALGGGWQDAAPVKTVKAAP